MVYTLVEQLYTGAQSTIAAISPSKQTPSFLSNILSSLSVLPARIEENFKVLDFRLDKHEVSDIAKLDSGNRLGPDPETFN